MARCVAVGFAATENLVYVRSVGWDLRTTIVANAMTMYETDDLACTRVSGLIRILQHEHGPVRPICYSSPKVQRGANDSGRECPCATVITYSLVARIPYWWHLKKGPNFKHPKPTSFNEKIDGCQRGKGDMQRSYHMKIYSFCLPFWEIGTAILTVVLLPFRVMVICYLMVTAWFLACIGLYGLSEEDLRTKPITGWRRSTRFPRLYWEGSDQIGRGTEYWEGILSRWRDKILSGKLRYSILSLMKLVVLAAGFHRVKVRGRKLAPQYLVTWVYMYKLKHNPSDACDDSQTGNRSTAITELIMELFGYTKKG
ncbi:Lysophosphatidylcholine acyltransferase [Eumeta japonica]|uniref:Lysophosphatidylcholine acyltransferase n=1 Tax=Eumeta variegata TaxID=151549 RepID=A0A4C1T3K7_EUMVA|nr:Lysophosphatidylcholine acyltransferase [Eumeta japonica]